MHVSLAIKGLNLIEQHIGRLRDPTCDYACLLNGLKFGTNGFLLACRHLGNIGGKLSAVLRALFHLGFHALHFTHRVVHFLNQCCALTDIVTHLRDLLFRLCESIYR